MRKATLIIGLIFMIIILVQSFVVGMGGELFEDFTLSQGGAIGRLVGILFGAGAAFVLSKPFASMIIYVVAALMALIAAFPTGYGDLFLWGIVAVVLAVLSFFSRRELEEYSDFET